MGAWLSQLGQSIGVRPQAIVVISAHWEAPEFSVGSVEKPELIYDYSGFPEHTYHLQYPAAGSPALANRVASLCKNAGINIVQNDKRGLDHGVFIPFKLIYPDANIPIIQLSLKRGLSPKEHIELGRAIAPLRDEGILIVGSGMSYHNLRGFGPAFKNVSDQFDDWLTDALCNHRGDERHTLLEQWEKAPAARAAHPREEHLLPLMVVAGAAANVNGTRIYHDNVMGVALSAFQFQ